MKEIKISISENKLKPNQISAIKKVLELAKQNALTLENAYLDFSTDDNLMLEYVLQQSAIEIVEEMLLEE